MVKDDKYTQDKTLDETLTSFRCPRLLHSKNRLAQPEFEKAVACTKLNLRDFEEAVLSTDWTTGDWFDMVRATALTYEAHAHQDRVNGDNYVKHPLWVAETLTKELQPEDSTLTVAALLHDFNEKGVAVEQLNEVERRNMVSQIDSQAELLVSALTTEQWPPSATTALYEQVCARYREMQSPGLGRLQGSAVRPSYQSGSVENEEMLGEGLMEVTNHFRYAANITEELSGKPGALFVKAYDLSHNAFEEDETDTKFFRRVSNKYRMVVDWFEDQVKKAPLETDAYSISDSGRDNLVSRIQEGKETLEEHASDWEHYRLQNRLWEDFEGRGTTAH